jgi:lauroyl/myristoyl acyltransferase
MVNKTTHKEVILLCFYDCILFLIKLTPRFLIPVVSRVVCFFGRSFVGRDIKILRENLEQMRDMPRGSQDALAFEKRTFFNHICSALETLKFSCKPESLKVDGKERLSELIEAGRKKGTGSLFVTAHLGSWESVGWVLSKIAKSDCHALARRPGCKALERFFDKFRCRLGMKVLLIDRPLLLRDMVKTLKSGGFLAVAMDQRPVGGRKTTVDFLGRKTDFVCGPAIAAGMAECPVYAVFSVRKGPMHYELISSEVAPAGNKNLDVNVLTQRMATAIEHAVDLYPDQWTWHYDRWLNDEACA